MATDPRNVPFNRDALFGQITRTVGDSIIGTVQLAVSDEKLPSGEPLATLVLVTGPLGKIAAPLVQKLFEEQLPLIAAASRSDINMPAPGADPV